MYNFLYLSSTVSEILSVFRFITNIHIKKRKVFYFTNSLHYTKKLISNTNYFIILEKNINVNVGGVQNARRERLGNMLIWNRNVF